MGLFGSSSPFDPLLDKACNEQNVSEDWSLILSICDRAKASNKNSKDCLAAIVKKMQHKVPRIALQSLVILDACVSNSGREFQKMVSSQDFINEMRPLVGRSDLVGEKIRELIQKWTSEFQDDAELSLIVSFYHYLRASGAHFHQKSEEPAPRSNNPDAVDSQKEQDDIALAIQMSLKDEEDKKNKITKTEPQSIYYSQLQNSGNGKTAGPVKVKALYDFEAAEDNELTFRAGDMIILVEESDPNWWEGSLNGKTGLFPANFVTKEISSSKSSPRSSTKKREENKKIVVKIDETILDETLTAVESADPSLLEDSPEMLENEERCSKMGAIIDARLSEMDTEQLELTQLNQKLLQCLQLYDSLMQQQFTPQINPTYMPQQQISQQMSNMNLQGVPTSAMYHQSHPDFSNANSAQGPVPSHSGMMQPPGGLPPQYQPMTHQNGLPPMSHQSGLPQQGQGQIAPGQPQGHMPQQGQGQMAPGQPQGHMPQQGHVPAHGHPSTQNHPQMRQQPPGGQMPYTNFGTPPIGGYEPTAPPPTPPVTEVNQPSTQQLL